VEAEVSSRKGLTRFARDRRTSSDGSTGYLPVERQYAEGGYEVERTGFGPTAASVLVERGTDMLRHLWKQS
jgi:hypothetical protein